MSYKMKIMTEQRAREILSWRYPSPYDLYNGEITEEAIKEFMDNPYYVIYQKDELIGFYCKEFAAQVPVGYFFQAYPEGYLDFGLGMKPEHTGKGNGTAFLQYILATLKKEEEKPLRLTVAEFNTRAITLYEKFDFQKVSAFTNADDLVFWIMTEKR
ncbi:GNAT family N-acetyltransferase [Bacillus sp. B1-b2]|uniref:GNAT family N-acetyltransferase n=1 Tax=Bacillus sp. B1-b2 TaxID=2653201 RepID=UPI0012629EC8|nr:GNAT family N-acetyltransferase [Bacillus sp. B1-b2]KAB7671793.1 GNAT family N-acetyltransferase [Bacillus sp. B1-b2]